MLTLSPAQRNEMWQRTDWSQVVRERAEKLVGHATAFESPEEAAEWAQLAESVVPDRNIAIKLYTYAWCGKPKVRWIRRARAIALDLGEFRRVAEIAGLEYEYRPSFELLIVQGLAYLDADLPEKALAPLSAVLKLGQGPPVLKQLHDACAEKFDNLPAALEEMKAQVAAESDPIVNSKRLLDMARLVRLYAGSADAEPYLARAFELNPADENIFSLLENWWVDGLDWGRLAESYRTRTEYLAADGRDIDSYRRAGIRLATGTSLPGLGVRLLQEGVQRIYKREADNNQILIAMLRQLVEHLVENGAAHSAVRLLAQALSHPRSDDEAMWVVNFGIAMAGDDVAMQRTKATFETLRSRLIDDNPEVADSMDIALETIEAEVVDWLEEDELSAIGEEIRELTRPSTVGQDVAERYDMVADVNVLLPAREGEEPVKLETVTRDLSETGLYLNCNTPLKIGDELQLTILLPGDSDWILVEHEMHGEVVRVDGDHGYGIRFTEVPESYLDGLEVMAEQQTEVRQL